MGLTIHTFKNYFATVFSVFSKISCIQMDPVFYCLHSIVQQEILTITVLNSIFFSGLRA